MSFRVRILTPWAFVLIVLFLSFATRTEAARQVSGKRECATCHIMWMDEFKREETETLVPYEPRPEVESGRQDVSSTERMCFSCHDGFVEDSRDIWREGQHGHPVGVVPSDQVVIPTANGKEIFPMNDEGKMYCGTCHTAHGVDWKSDESPIFLRVKNVSSSLCLACHLDKSAGPREGNHPIFVQPAETPKMLLRSGAQLADDGSLTCQTCHRPHGAKAERILVTTTDDARLCRSCHQQNARVVGSDHDLRALSDERVPDDLRPLDRRNPCANCHRPHDASGPALWSRSLSTARDDTAAEACLGCHNSRGVAGDALIGEHSHPTGVAPGELPIRISDSGWSVGTTRLRPLPLFDRGGFRDHRKGNVSCATCHDPHAGTPTVTPGLEPDAVAARGRFLRIPLGTESALCLNCHVDKRGVLNSPHMRVGHPGTQGEAPSSACGYCHKPHNAASPVLWRDLPQEQGGPIETLCRQCHRKGGEAAEHAAAGHGHPLGKLLDGKVNGPLPLYGPDGTRLAHGKRGLLDCGTCHDPHRWSPGSVAEREAYQLQEEGTAGNSFLRMSAAPESDLCRTCHRRQATVLGTGHDLRITAPAATNYSGATVMESGVCGQCHLPHEAVSDVFIWARPLERRSVPGENRCTGCHSQEGVARSHVPLKFSHPDDVLVWGRDIQLGSREYRPPVIPVYGEDGREDYVGNISCASCHDPHRWDPRREAPGPGKTVEGNTLNSFLRHALSAGIVCADCHGEDALFRYKYFHGPTSRREYPLYR